MPEEVERSGLPPLHKVKSSNSRRRGSLDLHRNYSLHHFDDHSIYHNHEHASDDETSDSEVDDDVEEKEDEAVPEVRNGVADEADVEQAPNELRKERSRRSIRDPNLISWDGPQDPANPKNWTMGNKWGATVIVSCFTLISPVASSMVAPAIGTMMSDLHVSNQVIGQLMLSIFVLAYAVGPLFLGPLSEMYGRVPVLQIANLWFLCWNLGCGFAQTSSQMLAFRFMSGLGGSAPLAIGGGLLSDVFTADQRGRAIGIYSLAPLLGPAIGPIAGGFITQNTTWRWVFWATTMACGVIQIAGLFFLRETYAPVLLARKAASLRKETGNSALHTEYDSDLKFSKKLSIALVRPFRLLGTQPIVQVLALYMAYLYGLMYLVLSTFPTLWEQRYGESIGIGGLNYISLGIGFTLGTQICAPLNDALYRRLKRKNGGVGRPEFRTPIMVPGSVLVPIGLFWYGWSAQARVHWIMPNIGAAIFAAGTIICFQAIQTYIVDSYTRYAASAIGAATVLRSLAGFGFPLFAPAMYAALDYGWGNSVLAFVGIAIGIPAPFLLWTFGERLRQRSQFAAGGGS